MADRPIPFSAPMVAAILDGRKSQTRRVLTPAPFIDAMGNFCAPDRSGKVWNWGQNMDGTPCLRNFIKSVGYAVGDRLYVREAYYQRGHWRETGESTATGLAKWEFVPADDVIVFDAPREFRKARLRSDPSAVAWHKRLGRFMPRKASRLTLTVTEVRVEPLQNCSEVDALAEGLQRDVDLDSFDEPVEFYRGADDLFWMRDPVDAYAALWDSINGQSTWDANPWIVAVSFDVRHGNIDL